MRRSTAAVIATAAVAVAAVVASAAAADRAVRAEVAVAGQGHPLDVRRLRIVDGLSAGASYRLGSIGIRNRRGVRTTYRLVVLPRATRAERREARWWLRLAPATVVLDANRSGTVGVRLELPDDAEPGAYTLALGVRPGASESAHLTFRIEPAETPRAWLPQAAKLATWAVPASIGAVLVVFLVRGAEGRHSAVLRRRPLD